MTNCNTTDVFGIHKEVVKSYVDREHVDGLFTLALKSEKQILVYGASKQGKTALVSRYCGYDKHVVYQLVPTTDLIDIYQHVLKSANIGIRVQYTEGAGSTKSLNLRAKVIASFAFFGKGEAETTVGLNQQRVSSNNYEEIPFNLSEPQDIAKLLHQARFKKLIILENFHYLTEDNQRRFAFDLRAFQELGIRFIILGVWRERNRMLQFNGDLLDRVQEVPVEPWDREDFLRIVEKGENLLNIKFSPDLINKICKLSFSSVGVFQDLLQGACLSSDITHTQKKCKLIDDTSCLNLIIREKTLTYGDRHRRALEAIASASKATGMQRFYYSIIDIVLEGGYEAIKHGLHINIIHSKLDAMSRGNSFKVREIKRTLVSLLKIQSTKGIQPPILYFDENAELLSISDSTLYFYLKNSDLTDFREQLRISCGNKI